MENLQRLAMDFMRGNDRNFYSNGIELELSIYGYPIHPESIWYSDNEDKIYIHVGCPEFEGDLDIESLSDTNQEILRDVFNANI